MCTEVSNVSNACQHLTALYHHLPVPRTLHPSPHGHFELFIQIMPSFYEMLPSLPISLLIIYSHRLLANALMQRDVQSIQQQNSHNSQHLWIQWQQVTDWWMIESGKMKTTNMMLLLRVAVFYCQAHWWILLASLFSFWPSIHPSIFPFFNSSQSCVCPPNLPPATRFDPVPIAIILHLYLYFTCLTLHLQYLSSIACILPLSSISHWFSLVMNVLRCLCTHQESQNHHHWQIH